VSATSRFCESCGGSLAFGQVGPAVAAALAHDGRLSDSGALELKTMLVDATRGDYEIQSELGRGGMAVVYKAIEIHLARPVAIKILPPELTFAKGATERFQREAKTAAALDHPNIIPIHRISSGGRLFWYAMKFLEGRSLAEILHEKGLLTVDETIAILEQVASALDYAHERGVVHRDVKPANVMLDVHGRVTVTDFGIAKELTGGALTGSGAILGTPYYMSPEQCRGGKHITGAADQYSLGVMAYQMVSGQLPFEADSAIDVIHKHVADTPPPLETLLPSLPNHVINAINRAMAKKASDRFSTVQAFVGALKNMPADRTLVMEQRPSLGDKRRSGAEKAPSLAGSTKRIAGGLVLVGGLAIGVWWLASRNGEAAAGAPEPAHTAATPPASGPAPIAQAPAAVPNGDAAARPAPAKREAAAPRRTPAGTPPAPERVATPANTAAKRVAAQPRPAAAPAAATATPAAANAPSANANTAPAAAPVRAVLKGFVRITVANGWANIAVAGLTLQNRVWAESLPAGTYPVTFTRDGYEPITRSITVRAGQETLLPVTMQPAPHP
jgi:serine/threonine-protein kinase